MVNNGKNDLGKFNPGSDKGTFVGYSLNKSYRIFNKRTQYIKDSVHVVFDGVGCSSANISLDDANLEELLKGPTNSCENYNVTTRDYPWS